MKTIKRTAITTSILFLVGWVAGAFLLEFTKMIVGVDILGVTPQESITPAISLGFLLALCSICSWILTWAYSKYSGHYSSRVVYIIALLITIMTAAMSISVKLLELQKIIASYEGKFNTDMVLHSTMINYVSFGLLPVIILSGIITAVLLVLARRKVQEDNTKSVNS